MEYDVYSRVKPRENTNRSGSKSRSIIGWQIENQFTVLARNFYNWTRRGEADLPGPIDGVGLLSKCTPRRGGNEQQPAATLLQQTLGLIVVVVQLLKIFWPLTLSTCRNPKPCELFVYLTVCFVRERERWSHNLSGREGAVSCLTARRLIISADR